MINKMMKKFSDNNYLKDLQRIDFSKKDNSITELKDINYINDGLLKHKLDVFYQNDGKLKPILIDIHGGGFISGDKEMDALFANCFAQRGFVVFNINYRLVYPKYNVFDQIEDVSKAVSWIVSNAEKYKGNINEMYLAGHSAGAVLAIVEGLLVSDKKMRDDFNVAELSYRYKGIILDCGLMHFYKNNLAYWGMRKMVFPKNYQKNSKYKHLVFKENTKLKTLPKIVLLTNRKDELKEMTYYFKKILDDNAVNNLLIDEGEDGHMGIVFKPYTEDNQKIIDKVLDFLM